jgi:hypothetical protein
MGSRPTFTNSKGVKKSGEHPTICQTSSLMLTPNVDVKYGVRRGMHDSWRPPIGSIARHFLSPLLWQFTPMRIALAMADSDMPNIGRSLPYIGVDPKR